MATSGIDAVHDLVLGDRQLQARLLATADRAAFVAAVVTIARERGVTVEAGDVEAALDARRRSWLLRWL